MSTLHTSHADIEDPSVPTPAATGGGRVRRQRRRRRRRRPSMAAGGSSETATDGSSFRFTESDSEENPSWHSPAGSTSTAGGGGGSFDESAIHGISGFPSGPRRPGSFDESSIQGVSGFLSARQWPGRKGCWNEEEVDLESGELELMKVNAESSKEEERECRICHLSLMENDDGNSNAINGVGIELGCDCKGDLGAAHKQCADTWFKIKGNTTCEICGAIAINIVGEQTTDTSNTTGVASAASAASVAPSVFSETRNFCHGRRIMNFLLACMVFAFVISWFFHFNVLP